MHQKTIWRLINPIKHYDWGSLNAVSELFNYPNETQQPIAEVWFGANSQATSKVITVQGEVELATLIQQDPNTILGQKAALQFDEKLPFLFKILSAQSPLSIQVHPDLSNAKAGFLRENELNIDLSDSVRNYKDPNHKPELIYALTPFYALNGFRELAEIVTLFELLDCDELFEIIENFKETQTECGLKKFFSAILELNEIQKDSAITKLHQKSKQFDELTQWAIDKIAESYPNDIGLLMPLILNVICLKQNEAIYLKAQTPHAYLFGTALEIMANSDNVLRAGLTSKNIDVKELLDNTDFKPLLKDDILMQSEQSENQFFYPVPVPDFKFSIIESLQNKTTITVESAEILLCINGEVAIQELDKPSIILKKGDSVFISANTEIYCCLGHGKLARAYY